MVKIDPKDKKYIITFKRKDLRPNQRDDKLELFRQIVGLEDIRDIVDITALTGSHMHDTLHKTRETVTDINSYETPFIFARLTPDQVGRLRRDPNISLVEEDSTYRIAEEVQGWQIPKLKANTAWAAPLSARGSGVNIAIIDTGVNPHIDFGPNLKVNQNFTTRAGAGAEDPNRHGTHVAGIAGAAEGNNEGIQGVAPNCNLWNLRAGDHQGLFASTDMLEALQYALQNAAQVINMSISGGPFVQAIQDAINAIFNTGNALVCTANGNTGRQETITYPAGYTNTIGISNLAQTNDLSPTSTWGTMTDLTAPGRDIVSLAENNLYRTLDGTSMATPAVSGVCALMFSAYADNGCPPYTPGEPKRNIISQVLANTATKSGLVGAGPAGQKDIKYGFGLPVANNAVATLKGVLVSSLA